MVDRPKCRDAGAPTRCGPGEGLPRREQAPSSVGASLGVGPIGADGPRYDAPACSLADDVWHYWLGWALTIVAVLAVIGLLVGYLVKVVRRPQYPKRPAEPELQPPWRVRRSTGRWPSRSPLALAGDEPFAESYHSASLAPDFAELTAQAEELVADATGLRSLAGPARARVIDRPDGSQANIASFQRLLAPVTDKLERAASERGPPSPLASKVAGVQVGTLLGWMSAPGARPVRPARRRGREPGRAGHRVLRRPEPPRPREAVRLPAPRVPPVARAPRAAPTGPSSPACRGCASTSSAWSSRPSSSVDPDPKRFVDALKQAAAASPRRSRTRSTTAGSSRCSRRREQRAALDQIGGLMSLLEGHGDVTMDRAGAGLDPERRALRPRAARAAPAGAARLAKLVQRLIGLEAKLTPVRAGRAVHRGSRGVPAARAARPCLGAAREPPDAGRDPRAGRWIAADGAGRA